MQGPPHPGMGQMQGPPGPQRHPHQGGSRMMMGPGGPPMGPGGPQMGPPPNIRGRMPPPHGPPVGGRKFDSISLKNIYFFVYFVI